jgi:hypothetical protein
MPSLGDIIKNHEGTAGSNRSWRVWKADSDPYRGNEYELWHYSTLMLKWRESKRYGVELLFWSTGHGSKSDQQGMNTTFQMLNVPYRFDRAGGSTITDIHEDLPEAHPMLTCRPEWLGGPGMPLMRRWQASKYGITKMKKENKP